ncbi:type II toxin-antitoxin system HicA family toxin [Spirulina sp. 06S082]|uniref:type II toxin-antitoxin system HicA family toxin n=1 Tax=Spirulina sp. 06S082 TaxID=3110248 RepID=UPI002B21E5E3|nr:type II toxin-antitoxin system HicA family toxin [Spirulina sp. 06S082]MEA5469003.1 type II toxin-antitoxin system HicA family toxin [Spirulina sp. 06S082]
MRKSQSASQKIPRFSAITASLMRLAIAGAICGSFGLLALQSADRAEGKERRSHFSSATLVSWLGMSITFWSLGEYFQYQRRRDETILRDRLHVMESFWQEQKQDNLELQHRLIGDRQEWESAIASYKVQLSEQIQQQQELEQELAQTQKVLKQREDIPTIDYAIAENEHLLQEKNDLTQELISAKAQIWHLQQAIASDNSENDIIINDEVIDNKSNAIRLSELTGISGDRAVSALMKLGFARDRQTGDHVILKRHLNCTIPLKSELSPATLKSALRQGNVNLDEFLDSLS